jgi:putative ABC transport system permease protein
MGGFFQDVIYACRALRKSPGFTLVALLTLGFSLGANTAIFSLVRGVILKPLAFAEPERIVIVVQEAPGQRRIAASELNFLDWQDQNTVFDLMAGRTYKEQFALTGVAEPLQLPGSYVTASFFGIFGVIPALGRTFSDGDCQPGRDRVAVMTHALWRGQFGGDPDIIGRSLTLDGEPCTVIGVLPESSPFNRGYVQIWRPLVIDKATARRDQQRFLAFARMKPGVSVEQARAEMAIIGVRLAQAYPDANKDWGVGVSTISDWYIGARMRQTLYILLAAVGMVLLIACANLANLFLMRVVARQREIAIRVAVGASRGSLIRGFLTESLVISLAGGALGVGLGHLFLIGLKAFAPVSSVPPETEVGLDSGVLLFSFLVSILVGLLIGLLPAVQASRPDIGHVLKLGGAGAGEGGTHSRARNFLVVAEVALAFTLLAGAGLLIRSLHRLGNLDLGMETGHILSFHLATSEKRLSEPATLNLYLDQIQNRLRALPGVLDTTVTNRLPMNGWAAMRFLPGNWPVIEWARRDVCSFKMVSDSYFRTLGLRQRLGRTLAATDRAGTPPVAVINKTMALKCFGDSNPIGQSLLVRSDSYGYDRNDAPEIAWEIVGVVANERVLDMENDDSGISVMYVTNEQSPRYDVFMLIRTETDDLRLGSAILAAVHEINRDQIVDRMKTLETIKDESLGESRFRSRLLAIFAAASLFLAAIGIYGVLAYSVSQRTREIGIRSALGANRQSLLWLVMRHGLVLTGIGLLVGLVGAVGLSRLLASLFFGVLGSDTLTLAVVAMILGVVALLACLFPAQRAARVDPSIALRAE